MAARRCFWSPSPSFHCFWVGGTRLTLVHALSRAHGCCPCCSASGCQSKAQSIWKGSAILWLEKLLCFWWWNSLFSIWTFSYSVSFIHKVPFCQKEMDTAGEMGRGSERERGRDKLREREKLWGRKQERKLGLMILIMHCLEMNGWWFIFLYDGQIDWFTCLGGGEGLEHQRRCVCGFWCRCFRIALSNIRTLKRLSGEFTESKSTRWQSYVMSVLF